MKKGGILMIIGSLLLLGLYALPLWNIMLGAPQYPDPLGMNIHINKLEGDEEFDLQNIDGLNHYIGMRPLPKEGEMWEFDVFPYVVGTMVLLGLVIGLLGYHGRISYTWFLVWFILMSALGILGVYDFNMWLTNYGTNLDPNAIMKLTHPDGTPMTYKPPLFGFQKLLNFDVYSYPASGAYLMGSGILLTFLAYLTGKNEWKILKSKTEIP